MSPAPVTLDVTDFGAAPGSRSDAAPAVAAALRAAGAVAGPVVLRFPPGEYHFWPDGAQRRELYVSNTVGDDPRYREKTIAVLVEAMDDLVISGEGACVLLHGLQTTFAVIDSRRVRVEGLEFDFAVPTVVDATVVDGGVEAGRAYRVIRVPEVTLFSVEGHSIRWHGEVLGSGAVAWEGRDALEYTQIHDPSGRRTWRGPNPLFDDVRSIKAVGEREIRIDYDRGEEPADVGVVYEMRLTTRDHPGALVLDSSGVTLSGLRFRFLHGFGVVAQASRDVTIEGCEFRSPPGSGRHTAGFADFVQFAGCSGVAAVRECLFDGPHDDPINVHGTYLRIADQPDRRTLVLEYAHPETAGLPQFAPGDLIEIVERKTLQAIAAATVERVRQPSGRDRAHPLRVIVMTAGAELPGDLTGRAAVENVTRTPAVHIARNVFRNVPTRAVLVTTRRPVVIEDNRFERPGMAAVYVSGDAAEWWESGPVHDLIVRGNEFVEPGGPAVFVDPRTDSAQPVHRGVVVEGNRFVLRDVPALSAKSTQGVRFRDNSIVRSGPEAWDVVLRSCTDADIDEPTSRVTELG
ncbi:right-handed parallel beta-helix repeat-containing protein [Nonomuraea aurantiaca]|uniref:right-handed parallel beta-helix repeat-containing protein n=1 Tax=Nonomuraea aurantiaca TaxID=2878562 RepID=UPI001CD9DF3B|nr:right-handed parallel beta-helix repeat-containing protein [Nonomuraea aurantiaca]MCA2223321.1 right-handed parallel beta-helix repeat-containing protein [Nonomuraea aurantiaca]